MSLVVPGRAAAHAAFLAGRGPAPASVPNGEGSGVEGGFLAEELQSAYKLPEGGGAGQTVVIVDAYDDPNAEADLKIYREKIKVPACTKEHGCFRKLNQEGKEENYPSSKYPVNENWGFEISLDLDMISAACPECKIVLVEAKDNTVNAEKVLNLNLAENTAAAVGGASVISNSWGTAEEASETEADSKYFNHPGIAITVAAGDSGYGVAYPSASPNVVSVGGTALTKNPDTRGWSEEVWGDSGGGCSAFEGKPAWQTQPGCAHRVSSDVSAVSAAQTPVSVYDSFERPECTPEKASKKECWALAAGTSVAAPVVAGVEALSTSTFRKEGPEAFYKHQGVLFDVAWGANGICTPPAEQAYLCHGEPAFDAPTGNGSPDFNASAAPAVAVAPVTSISRHEVSLRGSVNPQGLETHYHFEYGPSTSYGTSVPASEASAGSGTSQQVVSQSISGFEAGVKYHYRVVATNGKGTTVGEDRTFTTSRWALQATPNPTGVGPELEGVSCSSAEACLAVGSAQTTGRVPLAERLSGGAWTLQTMGLPSGATLGYTPAVSCSSASACSAAGEYEAAGSVLPLAERWNGTAWSAQTPPAPAGAANLRGVACPSATACTAVGLFENSSHVYVTLAERWNGTAWSLQTTPNPTGSHGAVLNGVSCSSATACTAVGYNETGTGRVALAERWNGTEWSLQTIPSPTGSAVNLYGVSCASATACTAVGSYQNGSKVQVTLGESWNGTEWKIQSTPNPSGSEPALRGVSCFSASACTAVGYYRREVTGGTAETALVANWNGSEWSLEPAAELEEPVHNKNAQLLGVSCASAAACGTVGEHRGATGAKVTLAETRTAIKPFLETKPASGVGPVEATLNGVVNPEGSETKYSFEYGTTTAYGTKTSEASAGTGLSNVEVSKAITGLAQGTTYHFRVVASNGSGTTNGADRTFTTTTASWRLVSMPNPSGTLNRYTAGVSCSSANACTVIGEYELEAQLGTLKTLAERWNGTEWTIQTTPNPAGAKSTTLGEVSCASATACMAVGYYQSSSGNYFSFTMSWNGTEWKILSTPEPSGALLSYLWGVSCTSASACTAVGEYETSTGTASLFAERWNGSEWTLQSTPNPSGAKEGYPQGVSCTSATACTMAGYYENASSVKLPFAESWNGTEWKLQSTPNPSGATVTEVHAVSCSASNACTLTGAYKNSAAIWVTLAERWNGSEWAIQSSLNPSGAKASYLWGVSCTTASACMVGGDYLNSSSKYVTLAESWNGSEWQILSTPNEASGSGALSSGMSCTSSTACVAVGQYLSEIYG